MRSRITWLVVATSSAIVISFVVPLCLLVQTLAEDRAMAAADQQARNVAIILTGVDQTTGLSDVLAGLGSDDGPVTTVLTPAGEEVGDGPAMVGDPAVERALAGEAFRDVTDSRGVVVLPVVLADGTAVVRTTVTAGQLREGVARAWAGIIGLGLALLLAAGAVARSLGRRISEPLGDVAATAHRLREGQLAARAEVRGTEETQELARALNGLAERTTELLAAERAVVGDLSHRLRTPVTALRLDAEAVDDAVLAERLQQHIGVLQRTVDSIVAEARRPVRDDLGARCEASSVVTDRIAFWSVLAEDQRRELDVAVAPGPLTVGVTAADLSDLVDIVVDNVFAHTPDGTGFAVRLDAEADAGVVLEVTDRGPGATATENGERRQGTSGLGLEIARRTAEGVGGSLLFTQGADGAGNPRGAVVRIALPRLPDHD